MKYIINIALTGILALPSTATPRAKRNIVRKERISQVKPIVAEPILVWGQKGELKAVKLSGGPISVLRERQGQSGEPTSLPWWNFSPDGRQLVFSDEPRDVDFFDAGAYRNYIFRARFDTNARVLLAAYGPKAVANDCPSFFFPAFDFTGRKIIVEENAIGQFMWSSSRHWIGIYDLQTRKRIFDSREFVKALPSGKVKSILWRSHLEAPSLSPDGNDIICSASYDDGDSVADKVTYPPQLVHLDLKHKSAEILISPNDRLPAERQIAPNTGQDSEQEIYYFSAHCVWHPSQKKFAFPGTVSESASNTNLFTFDLMAHKITRLTQSEHGDFCPQWSPDGKQVFWIRAGLDSKTNDDQIMRANADGSDPTAILPKVGVVSSIQILPHIADWSRYRKLSIEPLAGADK